MPLMLLLSFDGVIFGVAGCSIFIEFFIFRLGF